MSTILIYRFQQKHYPVLKSENGRFKTPKKQSMIPHCFH